jgi:uncharacterized protein YjgD (DUF1641 family)
MAAPILLNLPPQDPREALYRRLENAPKENAEALLAACDILQGLHERGILELAKGALGSSEKILEMLVEGANNPEVIRGIRNFIILTKLFASLDPRLVEDLEKVVPKALVEARTEKPLSVVGLLGKATNANTRRIMTIMLRVVECLGEDLSSKS